ncbi:hypothetical protein [Frigoribacterium sp. UYMn621]|uniref:hypothetical protein n=1 Tax=Frigoribacterium sp. UYMn621 TaxID=3156343 RepID=UPI003398C4DD
MTTTEPYTRTKSGAWTAESKRRIEAERAEQRVKQHEQYKQATATREALEALEEATEFFEGVANEYNLKTAQTEREERLTEEALNQGREEGKRDTLDDYESEEGGWIEHYIHRIKYAGLDTNLTALEVLELIRDRISQIQTKGTY